MTINDLMAQLTEIADTFGGETEVRIANQKTYPLQFTIVGVSAGNQFGSPADEAAADDDSEPVAYLLGGAHPDHPYADSRLWQEQWW